MKGLVYNAPRDVRVTKIDDPTIERETDALVKITTTNICG
jgi:glutathione-independent formaldehyde dehydrogenase